MGKFGHAALNTDSETPDTTDSDFAGQIVVRMTVCDGQVFAVKIDNTRPKGVAKIFENRVPNDVAGLLGLVFSLCGTAQTVAGLQALERARGQILSDQQTAARDVLREAEMLSQTVMRVFMDWPRLLGLAPAADVVRSALGAQCELEKALFSGAGWKVCGGVAMSPDVDGARSCAFELQQKVMRALSPDGLADQVLAALEDQRLNGFGALKEGVAPEMGALSRQWDNVDVVAARERYGAGLGVRLLARLADLRDLPCSLLKNIDRLGPFEASPDEPNPTGEGTATVETARGPLTHAVALQDGKVSTYTIDAPTDLNFLNEGVVVTGLMGANVGNLNDLKTAAELHVLAIDPCVRCIVEIEHA